MALDSGVMLLAEPQSDTRDVVANLLTKSLAAQPIVAGNGKPSVELTRVLSHSQPLFSKLLKTSMSTRDAEAIIDGTHPTHPEKIVAKLEPVLAEGLTPHLATYLRTNRGISGSSKEDLMTLNNVLESIKPALNKVLAEAPAAKGEDRGIFDMLSNVASSVAKHVVPFVMNHVVPTAISAIQSASSDRGLPEQFEKLHALTGTITAELAEELKKNRAKLDPSGKAPGVSDEEHVKQALVKIATPVVMARVVPAVAALQAPKGAFGAEPTHVEIDRLPAIISTLQPVVEGAVESGVTHAANTDRGFFSGLIKAAKGAVTTAVHAATTVATKGAEFLSNHPEIASLAKTALTDGVKLAAAA